MVVSDKTWDDPGWIYKEVFVTDVVASRRYTRSDDDDDLLFGSYMRIDIEYKFALIRKDGKPSKAGNGLYRPTIERIVG